ncbi:MAG: hypothetical protein HY960_03185 [Ignavibacteriae bacterium]|nr:hypothetical protein [Ignavibacteriota bacterium]
MKSHFLKHRAILIEKICLIFLLVFIVSCSKKNNQDEVYIKVLLFNKLGNNPSERLPMDLQKLSYVIEQPENNLQILPSVILVRVDKTTNDSLVIEPSVSWIQFAKSKWLGIKNIKAETYNSNLKDYFLSFVVGNAMSMEGDKKDITENLINSLYSSTTNIIVYSNSVTKDSIQIAGYKFRSFNNMDSLRQFIAARQNKNEESDNVGTYTILYNPNTYENIIGVWKGRIQLRVSEELDDLTITVSRQEGANFSGNLDYSIFSRTVTNSFRGTIQDNNKLVFFETVRDSLIDGIWECRISFHGRSIEEGTKKNYRGNLSYVFSANKE